MHECTRHHRSNPFSLFPVFSAGLCQEADWGASKHSGEEAGCITCHGEKHTAAEDYRLAVLPDEAVCAQCHEGQFGQFVKGKRNLGWASMMALPVTHLEPDELIEGGRGCGGCHNMGVKTKAQPA